ncbi:MAG: hypothetical protein CBC09_08770 [Cellvibrionales bacterium TMED49]|nr:MAG: hypothetical protein CBC09_08770 [Cellvibrionales bacterium TMED49]
MIPRQLTEFGVMPLEKLINTAIAYDTQTNQLIEGLDGTTVALQISPPELCYYVLVKDGHIKIKSGTCEKASVTLNGSIIAFVGILTQDRNAMTLAGSGVTVVGDTLILKRLENIFQKLDVDWEEALSDIVGDIPAHFIATSLGKLARVTEDNQRRIVTAAVEFVQEEWKIVPALPEFENFSRQVRQLSIDADRMSARIDNLILRIKT